MSSSGSRGPPTNRYNDKRKGLYNRRSLGSSGTNYPSSSFGTGANATTSQQPTQATNGAGSASNSEYSGASVPSGRRYNSSGFGYSSSYGSKYNNSGYYSGYNGYNSREGDNAASNGESPSFYSRPALNNRSSLSNSIPKRDRSRNNSLVNSKRSDTYYPNKPYFTKSQVDHYSTKKKYQYNSGYNTYYDQGQGGNSHFYSHKKSYPSGSAGYGSNYNSSQTYDDESSFNGRDRSVSSGTIKQDDEYEPDTTEDHGNDKTEEADSNDRTSSMNESSTRYVLNRDDYSEDREKEETSDPEQDQEEPEAEDQDQDEQDDQDDDDVSMEVESPLPEKNLEPGKDLAEQFIKQEPETGTATTGVDTATGTDDSIKEYMYPRNRLETEFEDLKKEYEDKGVQTYATVTNNVKEYPFYRRNIILYHRKKQTLSKVLSKDYKSVQAYQKKLWKEYKQWEAIAKTERKNMDEQLQYLHPPNDEMRRDLKSADISNKPDTNNNNTPLPSTPTNKQPEGFENTSATGGFGSRRSSRRHGDLVTTEAEFEEVLKNLSKQDDDDPFLKALRVSAPVPNLILDENEERLLQYMDSNNIVTDKQEWSTRVRTQFFDNFSPEEHNLFCEGFVKYPKKFGYVSKFMGGLRTVGECVIHYYLTKKAVNYKNLIAQHKKKANKKVPKKKVKSRNVSVAPDGEENGIPMEEDEKQTDDAASSVASPVVAKVEFPVADTEQIQKKRPASSPEETVSKKPHLEEPSSPFQSQGGQGLDKKKQRKKKEEEQMIPREVYSEGNGSIVNGSGTDDESKDKNKKFITSYWSITEASAFPILLQEHGTKWTTIADKLATKTATMVRNYFQRNAEKYNWINMAQEADKRLEEKFAAVVGKPEDEEPSNQVPPPTHTAPQTVSYTPHDQRPQYIPAPHMQHFGPPLNNLAPFPPHLPYQPPPSFKPNIDALITAIKPPVVAPVSVPYQHLSSVPVGVRPGPVGPVGHSGPVGIGSVGPSGHVGIEPGIGSAQKDHKSSIMSLLNSDSPSKAPTEDLPPVEPLAPLPPLEQKRNNISALLNSPSTSSSNDSQEKNTMPKLSSILTDDNN